MKTERTLGPAGKFAQAWIGSKLTPLVIAGSLLLGAFAVWKLPREEEPQIIVPMVDVFVQMPGASAREVEERVTKPMEKLLWEIPGVEYIYSTSSPGMSTAIVRFLVGQDEEKSIVRLNQKLYANLDLIPPGASLPLVKPRSIDDVANPGAHVLEQALRRLRAAAHRGAGRRRHQADAGRLGGDSDRRPAPRDSRHAGSSAAWRPTTSRRCRWWGRWAFPTAGFGRANSASGNREYLMETGEFLRTAEDVRNVVAGVDQRQAGLRARRRPSDRWRRGALAIRALLRWEGFLPGGNDRRLQAEGHQRHDRGGRRPASPWNRCRGTVIPSDVEMTITRNYGETAAEKSNELLLHMLIAVISVSLLICDHAGPARIADRIHCHSGDAGADADRVLSLRLHAEPHYAVCADLLHRHPGGRRHCGGGEHRAPLRGCRPIAAGRRSMWPSRRWTRSATPPSWPR